MSGRKGGTVQIVDTIRQLDDDLLEKLYCWVDELPLSRPKKNLARDFSDGVLVAEILKKYFPKQVEMHNYTAASASDKKINNWAVLNRKVLKKLNLEISSTVIKALVDCKQNAAESVLSVLREKIDLHLAQQAYTHYQNGPHDNHWGTPGSDRPEVDQNRAGLDYFAQFYTDSHMDPYSGYPQGYGVPPETHHPSLPPSVGSSNRPPWLGTTGQPPGGKRGEMLPKQLLDEKTHELQVKNETIEILQAKIQRLEHLLQLKDIRIEDLSNKLDSLDRNFTDKPRGRGAGRGAGRGRSVRPPGVQHGYQPTVPQSDHW